MHDELEARGSPILWLGFGAIELTLVIKCTRFPRVSCGSHIVSIISNNNMLYFRVI